MDAVVVKMELGLGVVVVKWLVMRETFQPLSSLVPCDLPIAGFRRFALTQLYSPSLPSDESGTIFLRFVRTNSVVIDSYMESIAAVRNKLKEFASIKMAFFFGSSVRRNGLLCLYVRVSVGCRFSSIFFFNRKNEAATKRIV